MYETDLKAWKPEQIGAKTLVTGQIIGSLGRQLIRERASMHSF